MYKDVTYTTNINRSTDTKNLYLTDERISRYHVMTKMLNGTGISDASGMGKGDDSLESK